MMHEICMLRIETWKFASFYVSVEWRGRCSNAYVEVDCFSWGLVVIYSLPRRREVGKISIYTLMEGVRKISCYVLYVKLLYQCVRDVVKRNIVRQVPSLLSADRSTDVAMRCLDYRGLCVHYKLLKSSCTQWHLLMSSYSLNTFSTMFWDDILSCSDQPNHQSR